MRKKRHWCGRQSTAKRQPKKMKALAIILMFSGYTLIYASVANQGRFATDPWAGLFADAYTS